VSLDQCFTYCIKSNVNTYFFISTCKHEIFDNVKMNYQLNVITWTNHIVINQSKWIIFLLLNLQESHIHTFCIFRGPWSIFTLIWNENLSKFTGDYLVMASLFLVPLDILS
jgi:hypothetical protein